MIPAFDEKPLTFSKAARLIPPLRQDRPVSPATIWRWSSRGCRSVDGKSVKLESWKVGGRTVTSAEALGRFLDALNGGGTNSPLPSSPNPPWTRSKPS
jgi:hypothetical protein